MMDTMMGGRAAEELIFGAEKITSGASSDLKQATSIASHMVKDWGMSEKVGLRTIEGAKGMQSSETLSSTTIESVRKKNIFCKFSVIKLEISFRLTLKSKRFSATVTSERRRSSKFTQRNTKLLRRRFLSTKHWMQKTSRQSSPVIRLELTRRAENQRKMGNFGRRRSSGM